MARVKRSRSAAEGVGGEGGEGFAGGGELFGGLLLGVAGLGDCGLAGGGVAVGFFEDFDAGFEIAQGLAGGGELRRGGWRRCGGGFEVVAELFGIAGGRWFRRIRRR